MRKAFFIKARDNKGMSLLELIIVVAIMSVMIGLTSLGISTLTGRPVEKCAQQLVTTIQHTKTMTMGKHETSIVIGRDTDGSLMAREITTQLLDQDGNTSTTERKASFGGEDVTVVCMLADGNEVTIAGSVSIELLFNRGSGALQSTLLNGVPVANCVGIRLSKGSKTQSITIVPLTGSVSRVM